MKKLLIVLACIGLLDAGYLTIEHYSKVVPPCTTQFTLIDCGVVLRSAYSMFFGIPLAMLGFGHYGLLLLWLTFAIVGKKRWATYFVILQSAAGAVFSLYLIYLQLGIIHAVCIYCMLSAIVSLLIFMCVLRIFADDRKRLVILIAEIVYKHLAKPLFFLIDPELVHVSIVRLGEISASIPGMKAIERWLIHAPIPELSQKIDSTVFPLPIGLAAGFDYEARVTQALAPLGFGFQSVGTITHAPWEGNPKPRLGRLPNSKSLMVNKGFRNPGADAIITKLKSKSFEIPLGISVGDPKGNISEIVATFKAFERANLRNTYFELNISCPNLHGAMSFYIPKNLETLLTSIDKAKLKKPLWVKMPINLSDKETLALLKTIDKHSPSAVIFGNLQHNRTDSAFDPDEVRKFNFGNFSGKPTFSRSNELIALAYKHYKKRFTIVGCGGVFTAEDAFTKIQLGASLIQMITGMIFQGPQVVAAINLELKELLTKNGYAHISDAVGKRV